MSENKTRPTDQDVIDFLNRVEHQTRREDGFALLEMMQEVTGEDTVWLYAGLVDKFNHYPFARW